MSKAPLYELVNLHKNYVHPGGDVEVLKGLDFVVDKGETVAIVGPSGVGKSTLLHLMGLLDKPTHGDVRFEGANVTNCTDLEMARLRNRKIGFVFQFFQLLPEFSAIENVMMPALIAGSSYKSMKKQGLELLDAVGLSHRSKHRPGELSGGEQQRVAIARSLIMGPDVILADEPTGNLDPDTGDEIEILLRQLNESTKTTLVVVTHKESLSMSMDRRVTLHGGRLVELQ